METDTDRLREGLNAYRQALALQNDRLNQDFDGLKRIWETLNSEYAGRAAEEFRQDWENTSSWFMDHIEQTSRIAAELERRIEELNTV